MAKKTKSVKKQDRTWSSRLNIIRGKNIVGHATKEDILTVFEYIDKLEMALDESDDDDTFGTEGWRHRILGED